MIMRGFLLVLMLALFFGACVWGLKSDGRGIAMKWGVRGVAALLFALAVVTAIAFIEGISR